MARSLDPAVASEIYSIALWRARYKHEVVPLYDAVCELWEERAAIREYLGGQDRLQAEWHAAKDVGLAFGAYKI